MRRTTIDPRPDSQREAGEQPLWNEAAFYEFTAGEVDALQAATNELEAMTLKAAQHIIDNHLYSRMGIPAVAVPLIERSWGARPPALYGRFDLAYDGEGPPKLLAYNADTPTGLREAAVVQRQWMEDRFPGRVQFNSIHQRLVTLWKGLAPQLPNQRIDLCSMNDAEDLATVTYLRDTALEAGLTASVFPIGQIGWSGATFIGPDDHALGAVFKLYPWEWMVREEYGKFLATAPTVWIEPPWKMLLSSKGLLPVLCQLFPRHPLLLEAHFDGPGLMMSWVKKPLLGREGANITMHQPGQDLETPGTYGAEGFIWQQPATTKNFDGHYPVTGSWVIGHEEGNVAGGIGVRESDTPILNHTSPFVPHLFG